MRLTCPNCGAQYEVPDEVIPTEGRDVQCSNCGNTWFQAHPDHPEAAHPPDHEAEEVDQELGSGIEEEIEPDWEEDQPGHDRPEIAARHGMEADVSEILRQEAEREARLRAEEAGGVESQPDLGLDVPSGNEAANRAREAQERMARIRGEEPATAKVAADAGSRRGLLPSIDEINSTLRSSESRQRGTEIGPLLEPEEDISVEQKKSGFMRGFAIALVIGVVLALVYARSDEIAQAVPQADPMLNAYVGLVDQARVWLDTQANALLQPN